MSGLTVLHVSQPVDGGVGRCVADLAAHQHATGLDVAVAAPPAGQLADDLSGAGVRHLSWRAGRSLGRGVPGEVAALGALVRRHQPALVHLHASKAALAGRIAVRGRRPTVVQPHAWSFEAVTGPTRAAAAAWERFAARWTTTVLCVSADEALAGRRAGVQAPVVVVPNGVDGERLPVADAQERARARAALGVPVGVPLAVCVGRLCEQKAQDALLDAWPLVLRDVPLARLALVGDGPSREAVARAAGRLAGVQVVGVAAASPWYAASDVVVLASRWEGMALVPLEAAARGRSVVTTDVAGARDAVRPGTGAVVAVGDVTGLASAVAARLGDPGLAAREGAAGGQHVRRHHRLVDQLDAITAVHRDLLDPSANGAGRGPRHPAAAWTDEDGLP